MDGKYATVDCDLCRKEFCASTIQVAMKLLQDHRDRDHYRPRAPQAPAELTLNNWDKRFLFFCGISPN